MAKIFREDRLGNLPDDILLTVLDRLKVRDAARTSILARRWRHLPAMLSHITIDVWDFVPKRARTCQNEEISRCNAAVVEATESILARRDSSRNTIRSLCMEFFLREDDTISIGHAVGHTMATHKVDAAEFAVLTERGGTCCNDNDLIVYGRRFMLFFDASPNAFGGVTRLRLENLRFGESDIPNVLVTCKRLKHLRLSNCDSGSWTILQVEHAQLSELVIVNCSFERVELNSLPKLTWLIFEGWISFEDPLCLGYVPFLEAVSLGNVGLSWHKTVKLSKILGGISVRDLRLGFECEKIWVEPERVTKRLASVFHQLRFLNLDEIPEGCDLTWTLFILEAAPNLKELYLTVWDHLCKMKIDKEERRALSYSEKKGVEWKPPASYFQHHTLAKLAIFGFQSDCMVRYVRRVMEAAVNLKDVFLYHRLACETCHFHSNRPARYPSNERERISVKKKITKGIESCATIHFQDGNVISDYEFEKMEYP